VTESPFVVRPLTGDDSREIATWRYDGPWRVYDVGPLDAAQGYWAVAGGGRLVGYCCAGAEARVPGLAEADGLVDVGAGMDPALVGRGHGRAFGRAVLDHLSRSYPGLGLRAVVQAWNERSLRLTRSLGFTETGRHTCVQNGTTVEYVVVTAPPPVTLRPWTPSDAGALAEMFDDDAMRARLSTRVTDLASARRWIEYQRERRQVGDRFAFAVIEGGDDRPVGHVVVKDVAPGRPSAEVGYWTAARVRGRGVAPRAVQQVTDWAFATFPQLVYLDLVHQVDNPASCRVAAKTGYRLVETLPPAPPAYPREGHRHAREK
jgi:RimJ/RimL family protein N-acetyltransferase